MKARLLFLAILYFPGTALHELSHFFAAKLLGVQTGRISLTPKFHEDGLELGHVEIAKTDFLRRFLVGIAPLVVGVSVLSALVYLVLYYSYQWWGYLLFAYVGITVVNTMSLSKSDLSGAWKVMLILALALAILIALH